MTSAKEEPPFQAGQNRVDIPKTTISQPAIDIAEGTRMQQTTSPSDTVVAKTPVIFVPNSKPEPNVPQNSGAVVSETPVVPSEPVEVPNVPKELAAPSSLAQSQA